MVDLVRAIGFRGFFSSEMVEGMFRGHSYLEREKLLINIYSEHIYIYII